MRSITEKEHINGLPRPATRLQRFVVFLPHVFIVLWMWFIFHMSAQPGDVSGEISGGVSHLFMKVWNAVFFQGWNEAEVLQMAEIWDYPIRKLAHMTEFGILAMLVYCGAGRRQEIDAGFGIVSQISGKIKEWFPTHTRYIATWTFTVLYAATDEIHQLFVPNRSGNGFDVCVDATGAFLALGVLWGIFKLNFRYRKR